MDMNTNNQNIGTGAAGGLLPNLETAPVIWALEAFPDHDDLHLRTAAALGRMYPNRQIIPVYVLSEESFTDRGFSTFLKPALKPMARKALANLLTEIRAMKLLTHIRRPRILIEASASRTACAKKLLRFAKKVGATEIAAGSHARKGFSRLFVGSFSEALLDEGTLPVLVTGPHTGVAAAPVSTVIFPTDFSTACTNAFPKILSLCSRLHADLHVFHKPVLTYDNYIHSSVGIFGGSWVNIDGFLTETFEEHALDSREWQIQADAYGVRTTFVEQNYSEPTAEGIVEYAERLGPAALIAMVSQTTSAASAFLGSVTRDVIRASTCPIYVAPREV